MGGSGAGGDRRQGRRFDRRHDLGLRGQRQPRRDEDSRAYRGFKGEFDFDLHAARRIDYIGVTFRTRTIEEVREIVRVMRADLWELVEAGRIAIPIDSEYSLNDAPAAVEHMRANEHFGKIVLNVGD